MIPDIALVLGAGWKMTSLFTHNSPIPLYCPELLCPLTEGEIAAQRIAIQLKQAGVKQAYFGVGAEGALYPRWTKSIREQYGFHTEPDPNRSPWTRENREFLAGLGELVTIPDPDSGNCWTTQRLMLEHAMQMPNWERLLVTSGDYIFQTAYLQRLLADAQYPVSFWVKPIHSMEFLDRATVPAFIEYLNRERATWDLGGMVVWRTRDHLAEAGIRNVDADPAPSAMQYIELELHRQGNYREVQRLVRADPITTE